MNRTTQKAFTLYELMITLAIVGVGLAVGVPNFQQYTANSRMTTTANDLHAALHLARSEAPRAKADITVCASSDSMGAATCSGTDKWDEGYIVFVDTDRDRQRDSSDATEVVLRAQPAIADGIELNVRNNAKYFSFAPSGLGQNLGGTPLSQVLLCDKRGNIQVGASSAARLLVITPLGRATVVRDYDVIKNSGRTCP